jgi:hypothetical protein
MQYCVDYAALLKTLCSVDYDYLGVIMNEANDSRTHIHVMSHRAYRTSHNRVYCGGCLLDLEARPRADSRPEIADVLEDAGRHPK